MSSRGMVVSPEGKARMSAAARKRWEDPEYRERTSLAIKGRKLSAKHRAVLADRAGEKNPNWKGGASGYKNIHLLAQKALVGRPCAHQDDTCKGRMDVALNHDAPTRFIQADPRRGLRYSVRVEDYMRLCHSHHVRYDRLHSLSRKTDG